MSRIPASFYASITNGGQICLAQTSSVSLLLPPGSTIWRYGAPLQQRIDVILNIKHLTSPICFYSWEKSQVLENFLLGLRTELKDFGPLIFSLFPHNHPCLCCCSCVGWDLNPWIITEKWLLWAVQRKVWSSLVVAVVSSLCFAGLSSFLVFSKWQIYAFSVVL